MRHRGRLAAALLCLGLVLAGCWDRAELEDQAYIVSMGIDRGEANEFLVSAVVALVQTQKAGVYGGLVVPEAPGLSSRTLTARASTLDQAMHILNAGMTRRLDYRHLRLIVIGDSLARAGLEPVIMEMARSSLIRGSGLLVQARGTAFDLLGQLGPIAELSPARAAEGFILQAKMLHMAPPVRMHNFLERLAATGGDPFVPVLAINRWVRADVAQLPPPGEPESAVAGDMPRGGGNPVEFAGTAIYRQDQLVGYLNVDQTQLLLALRGEMGKAYTTIPDPDHPDKPLTVRLHQENKPSYRVSLQGGKPRVHARLLFEAEVLAMPGGTDFTVPEARQRLEQALKRHVNEAALTLLGRLRNWEADPIGIGHRFRGKFATYDDWEAFGWRRHISDLQFSLESAVRVRRYALFTGGDSVYGGK